MKHTRFGEPGVSATKFERTALGRAYIKKSETLDEDFLLAWEEVGFGS